MIAVAKKPKIEVNPLSLKETVNVIGRYTIVTVEAVDGKKGHGVSRCSEKDEYKDKVGLIVARGRAIKSLNNKYNNVHNHAWYLG